MMEVLVRQIARLCRDEKGQDLIEYALIAAIISSAGVLVFPSIGAKLDAAFKNWGTNIYNASEPVDPM